MHPPPLLAGLVLSLLVLACARAATTPPTGGMSFEVDATWPKPLPDNWILGQVAGVAVDSQDHIWIAHRPLTVTETDAGAVQDPPISTCCVPAPSII